MTQGIPDALLYVDDLKLTGYLLSDSSLKSTSRLNFLLRFGFDPAFPQVLRASLLKHPTKGIVTVRPASRFGEHVNVRGTLPSPDGRNPVVTTGWTKRAGERVWRFTTLLPR